MRERRCVMQEQPPFATVEDLVASVSDLVDYFAQNARSPHARNRPSASPVPAEYTNWRDEQHAWRETAVLFDQSHHMPELLLEGPDALALLTRLGINTFANYVPGRAKQFIGCNTRGPARNWQRY